METILLKGLQHYTVPNLQGDGAAQGQDGAQRDDAGFRFDAQLESQETALLEVWMATFGDGTASEAYALRKALGSSSRSAESPRTGGIRGGIAVDSDWRNMTTTDISTVEVRCSLRDIFPTLEIAYCRSRKSTVKSGEVGVVSN